MEPQTSIQVPTKAQVDAKSQEIFETLEGKLGMIPNLYATIGYSSNALSNFLNFSENTRKGVFSAKEIEAISLAVSQANNCAYCKAAHTAIAQMNGFTEDETIALRSGAIEDPKLKALTVLAAEIARQAGQASQAAKTDFFAQGYDEKALIDLVAVVISTSFTNYAFGVTQVPVDFPAAKEL